MNFSAAVVLREHFSFFCVSETFFFFLVLWSLLRIFSGASEFASVDVILLQITGSITTTNNKRFIFQLSSFLLCYIVAGHWFDYTRKQQNIWLPWKLKLFFFNQIFHLEVKAYWRKTYSAFNMMLGLTLYSLTTYMPLIITIRWASTI